MSSLKALSVKPTLDLFARFFEKVEWSMRGCQIWTGHLSKGYGHISVANHEVLTHRLAYALYHGETPAELHVLHCCGTKACVRREHLQLGIAVTERHRGQAHRCAYYDQRGKPTPEYVCWNGMKGRCYNPNNERFHLYGGRGITVCARWVYGEGGLSGFDCFMADMGPKPSPRHSIDRYPDKHGDYAPWNCRWATQLEQVRNARPRGMTDLVARGIASVHKIRP